jgi:ABC-type bacteriocin/lantibiotic exporter with double-glycine peptidase domain
VPATLEELRNVAGTTEQGTSLAGLAKAARVKGLKAKGVQMDRNALSNLSHPAIAWTDSNHFVAVLAVNGDRATVRDPNQEGKEEVSVNELLGRCGGVLLTLSR